MEKSFQFLLQKPKPRTHPPPGFQALSEKKLDFEELVRGYIASNEQRLKDNDLFRKEQEAFNRSQVCLPKA